MEQPTKKERPNPMDQVRTLTGIAMGIFYIFVGIFMVVANQKKMLQLGNTFTYIFSVLFICYGLFRIWRGWQIRKNKNRKSF